ncbi:uncharacterized protein LOC116219242 isoform X2 [Clupea harengus]|uniref:Uncharacterized protein LOC116219242 isoform X2 n=1 Tax=Clupea harengus TaxID=7950 RepID=A0A6P8EQ85_CLUHA|nr:uncharacterized protein LOC116219242 isoform X2 [Clupea harengus]
MAELDLEGSMDCPSEMSGDDRSERFKEESSGYGTHTSAAPSEAPSEQSYQESINTVSSGIGSMSSGTPRGSRKAGEFRAEKTGPESGNIGRHSEMDRKRLEEMEERGKQQGAEDRQMEDRQMDVLGQKDAHTFSVNEDESENCEAPGPSVAVLSHMSIPQKTERGHLGGQLPEKKGEVEDMCSAEDRECNGDVEVFTPEITTSERTTYRFSCSSAGVFQCRYTGLVFKTDTTAEVQYHTASWDYGQLECEGLMAAGPLFKMKGLQGTVSQLGFPHCEIISSDKTQPLTIIHICDKEFEMLQPLTTSDTHVFFNVNGFSLFGLGKKRRKKCWIQALVILFLDEFTLNVFLFPRNVVLFEVREERRKLKQTYIETISNCKLIPDKEYSLSCPSEKHKVIPEIGTYHEGYEVCCPTFQVFLSIMEPIEICLHESGHGHVWKTYINLPAHQKGGTSAGKQ